MQYIKRTSKHGISMIKSSQCGVWRRNVFMAAMYGEQLSLVNFLFSSKL